MFNKKIVNNNGEIKCTVCGKYFPADMFYHNRNQCKICYKKNIQNSLDQRIRSALKAQIEGAGYFDPTKDTFNVEELECMIEEQHNHCYFCDKEFNDISDFEIAHKKSIANGGHFNKENLQLTCHKHNARGINGTKNILYMNVNMDCGSIGIDTNKGGK
jgi:hypothetical protein